MLAYAIEFDSDFEDLREECKLLDEYIEEGRYPGDLPWEAIGERDAYEAFEAAEKISRFVLARITFEED
ncbi:HEPN domain-containing protein [candidate division KSB1 bacterium]|nr:HEPN domain-containing protein [candidate division KSB1 bacterium]